MKSICVVALASLFLFGGAFSQPTLNTHQDLQTIKDEIAGTVNAVFGRLETLNADSLLALYVNSPAFVLLTTDGSMADYQAAQKHHAAWFGQLSALKVSTKAEQIRALSSDVAVCAWRGTFDMTFKSNDHSQADFGITFLFTRNGNHWKVAYQQTAHLPPGGQSKSK